MGTLVQQTDTNGSPCNYHESVTPAYRLCCLQDDETQKPLGELGLIEQIRREFSRRPARRSTLGIGDDCAILRPPAGCEVLVTTDFTLEGRHFRRDLHPPESVGHRCLARGLSDLAAMGATPLAAFLSLALPGTMLAEAAGRDWITRFFSGLRALGDMHRVPLAGGDTSESPGGKNGLILADIVLVGSAPKGKALRRSGGLRRRCVVCDRTAWRRRGRVVRHAAAAKAHPQRDDDRRPSAPVS